MRAIILAAIAALGLAAPLAAEPRNFESPEAAVDALVAAVRGADRDGLIAIFGPETEDVILTGEAAADREAWTAFLAAHDEMARVATEATGDRATLHIGRDQWPVPIPLVKSGAGWSFDAAAARDEIRFRRIGRNELDVMALMDAYIEVQAAYRRIDHDGDGVMEFAARIVSSQGLRDGLYWSDAAGGPPSPVGDLVASADADAPAPEALHGYVYRILTAQGPAAPGGERDYVIDDDMVASHALLAFPAAYGETGVMTFMVGENGVIWESDLGEDTAAMAAEIVSFDPGEGWAPVQ